MFAFRARAERIMLLAILRCDSRSCLQPDDQRVPI